VINVYVKTDTAVHYRNGISLFLVNNDAPGLTLRKLDMLLGRRGVGTYEIFFDDVRVPADRMVGQLNKGWDCLLSGLQIERMTVAAGYCGNLQAIVDLALDYAKSRQQFGRPIGSFQAIAHMLADMQTEVEAARMLTLHAAWKLASGMEALREISMAKLFASEAHVRIANQSMLIADAAQFDRQSHGAEGDAVSARRQHHPRGLPARKQEDDDCNTTGECG
jgi:alkylation response protein AidB-like acyl-CoA dehydrogenase